MKILAVDDDEIVLDLMLNTMRAAGFTEVSLASSAHQAMRIMAASKTMFDCIFLDIQMPGMNGIELCNVIRRTPGYRRTPIIMITAMQEKFYISQAFAAGATDYVTKPFDALELCTRMLLAEERCAERHVYADRVCSVRALHDSAMSTEPKFELSKELTLGTVPGVIDLLALENYLQQVSGNAQSRTELFALRVAGIEDIHLKSSSSGFLYTLTDIAEAITDNIRGADVMIAYAGNGAFVCVVEGQNGVDTAALEVSVRQALGHMEFFYDNGLPFWVDAFVGSAIKMASQSGAMIEKDILKVIAYAEQRVIDQTTSSPKSRPTDEVPVLRLMS
ncbi:response regulator [Pseudogemmobacter sp. W21_MBD1_M6]|uniref:response regulator n=1 Tax=Pseudogemmobacter sp. W21_MBD1_M6 TaxID=3240271 RepID=UPI003F97C06A